MKKVNNQGFTLIELLVSLVLFAILGILVANALQNSIRNYQVTQRSTSSLFQLSLTESLMRRDFAMIQPRPTIDTNGQFIAAITFPEHSSLEITTASRSNPGGLLNRSTLQQVRYSLQRDRLVRTTWPELDGRFDKDAIQEILLTDVDQLHFSLIDQTGNRKDHWNLSHRFDDDNLPAAVSVDITFKNKTQFNGCFSVVFQPQGDKD